MVFDAEPSLPVVGSLSLAEPLDGGSLLCPETSEDAVDDSLQLTHSGDVGVAVVSCAGTLDKPGALGEPEACVLGAVCGGMPLVGLGLVIEPVRSVDVVGEVDSAGSPVRDEGAQCVPSSAIGVKNQHFMGCDADGTTSDRCGALFGGRKN